MKRQYDSLVVALFYIMYGVCLYLFHIRVIGDYVDNDRAVLLDLFGYWLSIFIFVVAGILLIFFRFMVTSYVSSWVAIVPPLFRIWNYVFLPISLKMPINYLSTVVWTFILIVSGVLVARETERAKATTDYEPVNTPRG